MSLSLFFITYSMAAYSVQVIPGNLRAMTLWTGGFIKGLRRYQGYEKENVKTKVANLNRHDIQLDKRYLDFVPNANL